jgi:hypothetical protein
MVCYGLPIDQIGIGMARRVGFPEGIIEKADALSTRLKLCWLENDNNQAHIDGKIVEMKLKFAQKLCQTFRASTLSEEALTLILKAVQAEFSVSLKKLSI